MRLNMRSREEMARAAAEKKAARTEIPTPRPLNVRPVTQIGADTLLEFDDRYYLVPPVSFETGGELTDILVRLRDSQRIESPTRGDVAELRGVMRDAVTIMGGLIRPLRYRNRFVAGFLARLFWRFRRNPFRNATAEEVGRLLGFFSTLRTTPRIHTDRAPESPSR